MESRPRGHARGGDASSHPAIAKIVMIAFSEVLEGVIIVFG
jgi:hypothetical protein